jgi:enoyl-CoA hydratase/carnithine racemase
MSVGLPERIGRARALELAYAARRVGGAEALAIGLAERCLPDEGFAEATAALAAQIVGNSWGSNTMLKRLHRDQSVMTRQGALEFERTRPYGLPVDAEQRRLSRAW